MEMRALATEAMKNKSAVTNTTREALNGIKQEMQIMMGGINKTHGEDQKEVNRIQNHLKECNTDIDTKLSQGGSIHGLADLAGTAESTHDNCRNDEVDLLGRKTRRAAF